MEVVVELLARSSLEGTLELVAGAVVLRIVKRARRKR